MKYQLQGASWGANWGDEEDCPPDPSALEDWIKIAHTLDTYGGKYQYRIIDETGTVVWHEIEPYEAAFINLCDPSQWIESIRRSYGIDVDRWRIACNLWVENHKEE